MCVDHVCRSYILIDSFLFIAFHVCSCCLVSCRVASWHVYWIRRQLSHVQCRKSVDKTPLRSQQMRHRATWLAGLAVRVGGALLVWTGLPGYLALAWLPRCPAGLALDPTTTSNKKRLWRGRTRRRRRDERRQDAGNEEGRKVQPVPATMPEPARRTKEHDESQPPLTITEVNMKIMWGRYEWLAGSGAWWLAWLSFPSLFVSSSFSPPLPLPRLSFFFGCWQLLGSLVVGVVGWRGCFTPMFGQMPSPW